MQRRLKIIILKFPHLLHSAVLWWYIGIDNCETREEKIQGTTKDKKKDDSVLFEPTCFKYKQHFVTLYIY